MRAVNEVETLDVLHVITLRCVHPVLMSSVTRPSRIEVVTKFRTGRVRHAEERHPIDGEEIDTNENERHQVESLLHG